MKWTVLADRPPRPVKGETSNSEYALGCLTLLLSLPLIILLRGWVLSVLWVWFILPVFGLASPGLAACLGLAVVAEAFVGAKTAKDSEASHSFAEGMLILILKPVFSNLFLLGLGWVFHCFMAA